MNLVTPTVALPERHRRPDRLDRQWLRREGSWSFFALGLLFALEASMFYTQLAQQILPYFPRYFDQTGYTVETYQLIDQFRNHGWSVFLHRIIHPGATGLSFVIQGALLSLIGGADRGALLSLNLIYFIALQVCLFVSVRSRTRNIAAAWLALAFLLSARTNFNIAGGLYDYRIDYSALCLYGIFCCLLIVSRGFQDRRATIGVAVVGVLLILERFFTILYVGPVLSILFLSALIMIRTSKDRDAAIARARNLFICGAGIVICVSAFLLEARSAIYNYYIVGHFLSTEKYIRAAENGVKSLWDDLTYYPWSVAVDHFGAESLRLTAAVLLIVIALCVLGGFHGIRQAIARLRTYKFEFFALLLAIAIPIVLLTLDYSKSPVVAGIVTIPCILVVVFLVSALPVAEAWPLTTFLATLASKRRWLRDATTAACFSIGFGTFLANGTAPQHSLDRADLERINAMNNAISGYVVANAMQRPSISFDRVIDYLNVGTLQLAGWERWGRFIEFDPKFGYGDAGIFATPRDTAMKLLQESDIVILSDPRLGRAGSPYPMDTKIREYWSDMWQWANANLLQLYQTNIDGIPYRVFHKPLVKSEGGSGEWITSQGLTLTVNRSALVRWPFIVLEGDNNNAILGGEPKPTAAGTLEGRPAMTLPTTIATPGTQYRVVIDAHAAAGTSGHVEIHLTFDRYFVPKERGINDDTRKLVMKIPTRQTLKRDDKNGL